METLAGLIKFLESYPTWAKLCALGGVVFTILVLVLAPRIDATASSAQRRVYLWIKAAELYPEDPSAKVRIDAYVNDTVYKHPSVGGVEWMKLGPGMATRKFNLPSATEYQIRFEMFVVSDLRKKTMALGGDRGESNDPERKGSQEVVTIKRLPYDGTYNLYEIDHNTREAAATASISFGLITE
jgi:hypothetical protein